MNAVAIPAAPDRSPRHDARLGHRLDVDLDPDAANEPPYPPPVNHLGIDRINFYVKDLTATVRAMNELGFEQLGPIGGSREIGIVFFFDPDGIKVQFAGPQTG